MAYFRVSPGIWRDSKTGKTINSATQPGVNKGPVVPGKAVTGAVTSTLGGNQNSITGQVPTDRPVTTTNPNTLPGAGTETPMSKQVTTQDPNTLATGANGKVAPDYNTALTHAQTQLARQTDPAKKAAWQKRVDSIKGGSYATTGAPGSSTATTTTPAASDPLTAAGQNDITATELYGDLSSDAYNPWGEDRTQFDNQPYIDAAFAQLTRGVDDEYKREKEALAAQLYNTGNDVGSPKYNNQMKILEDKYSGIKADAKNQAVLTGEAAKTNYFQNQSAVRASDIALLGQKSEIRKQFKDMGYTDKQIELAMKELAEKKRSNKASEGIARLAASKSGGGGGSTPEPDSAFSNSPYPGAGA